LARDLETGKKNAAENTDEENGSKREGGGLLDSGGTEGEVFEG